MMEAISFFVPGVAKPAGSKRGFMARKGGVPTGKVMIVDACKGSADWKSDVRAEARKQYQGALLSGALFLSLCFLVRRPKGHFGTGSKCSVLKPYAPDAPTSKPDVLKLARGVEDALTGIVWVDDSQIVTERIAKRYSERPGVEIEIREEQIL